MTEYHLREHKKSASLCGTAGPVTTIEPFEAPADTSGVCRECLRRWYDVLKQTARLIERIGADVGGSMRHLREQGGPRWTNQA